MEQTKYIIKPCTCVLELLTFILLFEKVHCQGDVYSYKGDAAFINFTLHTDPQPADTFTLQKSSATIAAYVYAGSGNDIKVEVKAGFTYTGELSQRRFSFKITNVQDASAGIYKARSSTGGLNQQLTLYILKPLPKPNIQQNVMREGSSGILTCIVKSQTLPAPGLPISYIWTVNGTSTTSNSNILTINNIQRNDKHNLFRCIAREQQGENTSTSTSDAFHLNVLYAPDIQLHPHTEPYIVYTGQPNATLKCHIITANPSTGIKYKWSHNGNIISGATNNAINMIVTKHSGGTYTCTATNSAGATSTSRTVVVHFPPETGPTIKEYINRTLLEEGDGFINITCLISSGNPLPILKFECINSTYYANSTETVSSIHISVYVSRLLNGRPCVCEATSPVPVFSYSKTTSISFAVRYPKLQFDTKLHTCDRAKTISLHCKASDIRQGTKYLSWVHTIGDETIRYLGGINVNNNISILTISVCSYQDYGNYTCRADNGIMISTATSLVHILDQPILSSSAGIRINSSRDYVEIFVDFFCIPEPEVIDWYKNDEKIYLSEKLQQTIESSFPQLTMHGKRVTVAGYRARLVISEIDNNDFGNYRVRITNARGEAIKEMKYEQISNDPSSLNIGIIIGISCAAVVAVGVIAISVCCFLRIRKPNHKKDSNIASTEQKDNSYETINESGTGIDNPYDQLQMYENPINW